MLYYFKLIRVAAAKKRRTHQYDDSSHGSHSSIRSYIAKRQRQKQMTLGFYLHATILRSNSSVEGVALGAHLSSGRGPLWGLCASQMVHEILGAIVLDQIHL